MKKYLFKLLLKLLNQFDSGALRLIFSRWFGVTVGMYSYGCFDPRRIPSGTVIGRYCSFSSSAHFFPRNHGIDYIALTPYLYNSQLGVVPADTIENAKFVVEDDVWIGHNATITAKAATLGRGCVIAANSVVTRPVPRYAIVAGNPARIVRYRFPKEVVNYIEDTQWWTWNIDELKNLVRENSMMVYQPEVYFAKKD